MTETHQEHLRGIARGGVLGLGGAVVSAGTTFLTVLIVTNSTDRTSAGEFFSATSLFLIAVALCSLGTDAGLGRFTALHLVNGDPGSARACWTSAFSWTLGLSGLVALAAVVARDPLARALGLESSRATPLVVVLALALPAATFMSVSLAATRSLSSMRATVLVDKVGRSALQLVAVLVAVAAGAGLVQLGVAWAGPYAVACVVAAVVVRRTAHGRLGAPGSAPSTPGARRAFWAFTWPRSVAQLSQMTIQRADIIIIAALMSPAAAAVYTAATRFVAFGQFGSQAIQQTVQPRFSQLLAAGRLDVLADIYRTSTAWAILASWPIYVAVGAAPAIYLSLFGGAYRDEGAVVVVTMALAMMVGVASGPVDTMLLMGGRSSLSLVNSLVALATDLSLCFLLIPRMGILGAAVAWNAAVVVRSTLGYLQVRSLNGLSPFSRATLVAALSSSVTFGVPLGALGLSGHLTLTTYLLALPVLAAAYAGVLWTQRRVLHLEPLLGSFTRRARSRASAE